MSVGGRSRLALPLPACLAAGCATQGAVVDPAHPVRAAGWVETRLSFGLGPADVPSEGMSEAQWRRFLDQEVTTRFPSGLSVIDIYGQWQGPGMRVPERLRSKLLVIDHPDDGVDDDRIEAIRAAWKRLTGDRSVLSVTETPRVSF